MQSCLFFARSYSLFPTLVPSPVPAPPAPCTAPRSTRAHVLLLLLFYLSVSSSPDCFRERPPPSLSSSVLTRVWYSQLVVVSLFPYICARWCVRRSVFFLSFGSLTSAPSGPHHTVAPAPCFHVSLSTSARRQCVTFPPPLPSLVSPEPPRSRAPPFIPFCVCLFRLQRPRGARARWRGEGGFGEVRRGVCRGGRKRGEWACEAAEAEFSCPLVSPAHSTSAFSTPQVSIRPPPSPFRKKKKGARLLIRFSSSMPPSPPQPPPSPPAFSCLTWCPKPHLVCTFHSVCAFFCVPSAPHQR